MHGCASPFESFVHRDRIIPVLHFLLIFSFIFLFALSPLFDFIVASLFTIEISPPFPPFVVEKFRKNHNFFQSQRKIWERCKYKIARCYLLVNAKTLLSYVLFSFFNVPRKGNLSIERDKTRNVYSSSKIKEGEKKRYQKVSRNLVPHLGKNNSNHDTQREEIKKFDQASKSFREE